MPNLEGTVPTHCHSFQHLSGSRDDDDETGDCMMAHMNWASLLADSEAAAI
jgi:hypothetical protein